MALTTTTFRMDTVVKENLRNLLTELGMDMSTYFVMAAKQAVREQGIPFKITMDIPNSETIQAMKDTKNGVGVSKGFTSVAALMEDLDADN
ncbi:MAG: type II toxin-antitoxin system RelB/DinJ family antitoxin [Synergistaceae bacterium]|nr:type II toxin-antitoxin system RelB/DinJ family antitoxin [Synergistaceae bacterium]